jgi:hypothetical protein
MDWKTLTALVVGLAVGFAAGAALKDRVFGYGLVGWSTYLACLNDETKAGTDRWVAANYCNERYNLRPPSPPHKKTSAPVTRQ